VEPAEIADADDRRAQRTRGVPIPGCVQA
jgi:hypothetical protein